MGAMTPPAPAAFDRQGEQDDTDEPGHVRVSFPHRPDRRGVIPTFTHVPRGT